MSTLFHGDTARPPAQPSAATVRALEGYGYKVEAVRAWSSVKAETVLASARREEAVALRRAAATAAREGAKAGDAPPEFGEPSRLEREVAAACLDDAAGLGRDELCQTLMYTVQCLTTDEVRRVAGYFVKLFRGPA